MWPARRKTSDAAAVKICPLSPCHLNLIRGASTAAQMAAAGSQQVEGALRRVRINTGLFPGVPPRGIRAQIRHAPGDCISWPLRIGPKHRGAIENLSQTTRFSKIIEVGVASKPNGQRRHLAWWFGPAAAGCAPTAFAYLTATRCSSASRRRRRRRWWCLKP